MIMGPGFFYLALLPWPFLEVETNFEGCFDFLSLHVPQYHAHSLFFPPKIGKCHHLSIFFLSILTVISGSFLFWSDFDNRM